MRIQYTNTLPHVYGHAVHAQYLLHVRMYSIFYVQPCYSTLCMCSPATAYVGVLYVTRLTPACMHTLLVLLSLMNVTTPHVTTVNRWKGTTITAQKLCSGDWDRTLYFTVWDWNRCVRVCVRVCVHVSAWCMPAPRLKRILLLSVSMWPRISYMEHSVHCGLLGALVLCMVLQGTGVILYPTHLQLRRT